MRRKNFEMGAGKYYFNVSSGPQNITIHRVEKENAVRSYQNYIKLGKNVEWLGKWDGKKFSETTEPAL